VRDRYDLVIVGMGSAGMSAAAFAATLPVRVAVVERARVGGDCLWTGCVPSKALLASAKAAHTMRTADRWGLPAVDREIDLEAVWKRVRAVQEQIASTDDDPQAFRDLGVEVIEGDARLAGPRVVEVTGADGARSTLRTRFVLVATGSRPATPELPGLDVAGFLTNETIFELERPPSSLAVVGGGPIGAELAQALSRLGVRVTVLERGDHVLGRDEPELADALAGVLQSEGVELHLGVEAERVSVASGRKVVHGRQGGTGRSWEAAELFVCAGRSPNVEGLGLEALGIEVGDGGVVVDERMRTTVPEVYAAGDVAGRHLFTHSAGHEAVRAVRDMFFPGRGTVSTLVPWCTFTDPELAHAGLTSAEARERHGEGVEVHRHALAHSDRARAEGHPVGEVVVVTAGGTIVGAHVLAPAAGEVIHELALAIQHGMSLSDVAGLIHVYPTYATSVGEVAAAAAFEGAHRFHWTIRPLLALRGVAGALRRRR
jgi:pyruvate/2-oxoglutarate dehydrogenase complex dihydrolipoamide dehydrogenase (E3) component